MPARIEVSPEAQFAVREIAVSRGRFDKNSGYAYLREFLKAMENVADGRVLHEVAIERGRVKMRRAVVESTVVVYMIVDDVVYVTMVFGPGRDWQSEL